MTFDLRTVLTPELFNLLLKTWYPFDLEVTPPDFGKAVRLLLFSTSAGPIIRDTALPALRALSELRDKHTPDLFSCLPSLDDPGFPQQAIGLMLLLDQAPRVLLKGLDQRWVFGYFDDLAIQYVQRLEALPLAQRPTAWSRWQAIASPEAYIMIRGFVGSALVHSETASAQAVDFVDATRTFVEELTGTSDPIRDRPEDRWDLYGFPKMVKSGGPSESASVAEASLWMQHLKDVHKPIIDAFGRYPYRNWVLGREMRPEEQEWLDKADLFKPPPDEIPAKIKEDVSSGTWTPIGSGTV